MMVNEMDIIWYWNVIWNYCWW